MPINDYTQSILNARPLLNDAIKSADERIIAALQKAHAELDALVRGSEVNGEMQLLRWRQRQGRIRQELALLGVEIKRSIESGSLSAATSISELREAATNALLKEAQLSFAVDFASVPRGVLDTIAKRIDSEGLKVSANVWANAQTDLISREVEAGIVRGRSATEIGRGIRQFVLGSDALTESELKDLRTVRGVERRLLGTSIKAKAQRLARSEIANSAWESGLQSAEQSPIVKGIKWNLSSRHSIWDVCDILSTQNLYGLGPGIYPPSKLPPRPHPNDLCFLTDVLRDATEWDKPKETLELKKNPDDIPTRPANAKGTDGFIEKQRQTAIDLVKAAA